MKVSISRVFHFSLGVALLAALFSCTTTPPNTFHLPVLDRPFQLDMEINKKDFVGIAVVEYASQYKVKTKHKKSEAVYVSSCGGHNKYDSSWFSGKAGFTLDTSFELDKKRACPYFLKSLTDSASRDDRQGIIIIADKLDALLFYAEFNNDRKKSFVGTGYVESPVGSNFYLKFEREVVISGCGLEAQKFESGFLVMPEQVCVLVAQYQDLFKGESVTGSIYLLGFKKTWE